MTAAVETFGLTKEFQKGRRTIWQRLRREPDQRSVFRAVDGIDLVVDEGEIFGVLGPNGAGKTTTLKMLATLLEPTSGEARVLGIDVRARPREVRARLGAMLSGERSLYWKLTGRENLEYFAALYHVPAKQMRPRIDGALEAVHLTDRADDYVERYSTGMRQRLALARALLPDPPLVILDEPTVGLDPQSARDLRDRVRDLRAQGRTVLLTTHYMEEADQLCDRVAIIDHGKIVALGSPEDLKAKVGKDRVQITTADDEAAIKALKDKLGIDAAKREGFVMFGVEKGEEFLPKLFAELGVPIRAVQVARPTLDDVFLAYTGSTIRDAEASALEKTGMAKFARMARRG
jgi:ABC-2 type transport system ATP-binding protein